MVRQSRAGELGRLSTGLLVDDSKVDADREEERTDSGAEPETVQLKVAFEA